MIPTTECESQGGDARILQIIGAPRGWTAREASTNIVPIDF
jgi:hypothetical protein